MKIAIYTPYLDHFGGGEKYMLTIAETLAEKNSVDILLGTHLRDLDVEKLKNKTLKLHGIDLRKMNFVQAPIGEGSSGIKRSLFLKNYDYFFCVTDGSVFYATAKHNILHFQVPFVNSDAVGFKGRIKLSSWGKTIFNSEFTKQIIEESWPIKDGIVVYPPVKVEELKPLKKKNQILSVGRFYMATKSKKHEVMIEAFKDLAKSGSAKRWSLHLAGGAIEGNEIYIEELKGLAKGADVSFHPNISLEEMKQLYGESKIYWHAAGFGEDDPTKHEHFGITTVEAMAAGCVPVVINKGGQPEIVVESSGFLWDSTDQLKSQTIELMTDQGLREQMAEAAINRAKVFNKDHFRRAIEEIVYGGNN